MVTQVLTVLMLGQCRYLLPDVTCAAGSDCYSSWHTFVYNVGHLDDNSFPIHNLTIYICTLNKQINSTIPVYTYVYKCVGAAYQKTDIHTTLA